MELYCQQDGYAYEMVHSRESSQMPIIALLEQGAVLRRTGTCKFFDLQKVRFFVRVLAIYLTSFVDSIRCMNRDLVSFLTIISRNWEGWIVSSFFND